MICHAHTGKPDRIRIDGRLPVSILQANLTGIILNLCTYRISLILTWRGLPGWIPYA